jgi:elongation factor P
MEYLYSDGSHHHFMNTENYEQTALSEDELGDAAQWLTPGMKIQAEFYEGSRWESTATVNGTDSHAN